MSLFLWAEPISGSNNHQPHSDLDCSGVDFASMSKAPDFYIGTYNGHAVGLVLHGSALDATDSEHGKPSSQLKVQYAHRKMFLLDYISRSGPNK